MISGIYRGLLLISSSNITLSSTTSIPIGKRVRFINLDELPFDFLTVQPFDSLVRFVILPDLFPLRIFTGCFEYLGDGVFPY